MLEKLPQPFATLSAGELRHVRHGEPSHAPDMENMRTLGSRNSRVQHEKRAHDRRARNVCPLGIAIGGCEGNNLVVIVIRLT